MTIKVGKLYKVVPSLTFSNGTPRPKPLNIFVAYQARLGENGWYMFGDPDYIPAGELVMPLGTRLEYETVCLWGERMVVLFESCLQEV